MSIIKRNSNGFFMPELFDDFMSRNLFDWGTTNFSTTGTTLPAVNIRESNENFEVEMAAPGMTKNDFNILLEDNTLTITSEKSDEQEEKDGEKFSRREFRYQSFQRRFTLPKEVVDVDQINAKYENGILKLSIPKKEEAKQKPPRTINIS
jgi:HSP20 family protein